jgi:Zn finger protein HypA/HybF involved in hydrogenase expression
MYVRICKYCDNEFKTKEKFSEVCPTCKEKNHLKKKEKNLFNHHN